MFLLYIYVAKYVSIMNTIINPVEKKSHGKFLKKVKIFVLVVPNSKQIRPTKRRFGVYAYVVHYVSEHPSYFSIYMNKYNPQKRKKILKSKNFVSVFSTPNY